MSAIKGKQSVWTCCNKLSGGISRQLTFCVLFVNKVKKLSPGSQSGVLQSSICNAWEWSVHWVLPVKHNICNLSAFRRAPPIRLSFASGTPGEYIHFASIVRDVFKDIFLSPTIQCREDAWKERLLLFTLRHSFAEPTVSALLQLYKTLIVSAACHTKTINGGWAGTPWTGIGSMETV